VKNRFSENKRYENMFKIDPFLNQMKHWWNAKSIYSIHSPFVFEYVEFVLDKNRQYYPFIVLDKRKATFNKENSFKKKKERSFTPPLKSIIHEHIFRHFIFTKGSHFLEYGSDGGWLGLYCHMAGADSSTLIDPHPLQSQIIQKKYYSEHHALNQYPSLDVLMSKPGRPKYDCICIYDKKELNSSTIDQLLKIANEEATIIIPNPFAIDSPILDYIENKCSLILKTDHLQIMWRKFEGESQKVNYTSKSWTKPWEFIHAV